MAVYQDPELERELREGFRINGKPIDLGKACLRFKNIEELHLPTLESLISRVPPDRFIQQYETARKQARERSKQARKDKRTDSS